MKIAPNFRGSTIPAVQQKHTKLLGRCRRKKVNKRKARDMTGIVVSTEEIVVI